MAKSIFRLLIVLLVLSVPHISNAQKFGFQKVLKDAPNEPTVFCIANSESNRALLKKEGLHVKFQTKNWLFITSTPQWIETKMQDGVLDNFYFEFAPPALLADTARMYHNVDDVQLGAAPLNTPYTGNGVIVGVVDQGIDWQHPDFIDNKGNTRVLRYWDHSTNGNPPSGFGYGYEWDSTSINNGTCTATEESSAHGSTVAGQALGNGNANGTNIGMAPDANIVIVETNFSLPNWTLTIADAVDYIFQVADEYDMPAVVNLSLGSYFGSHDGNDPAAEAIEAMLDEKPGRIVVGAAGNGGNQGKFHAQHMVNTDTSFVWFTNNPSAQLGNNTIFFDLWSDTADALYSFAMGANAPGPGYSFRGRTNFYNAATVGDSYIADTIWNGSNRIAVVEMYTEEVYGNFHLQVFVSTVDSTDYLYRFETTGDGKYDLWSGEWLQFNDMVSSNLPTPIEMPDIVNYVMPDSMQTIVSSWNCSEKVVSVANMKNRKTFTDNNGLTTVTTGVDPQERSLNSSIGPTRHGLNKPDVTAAGDNSVSAAPLWLLTNPAFNAAIDSGGWHAINGGTSMASPVVSGIAALYLERCGRANYANFLNDIHATSYADQYTGTLPNLAYGYGKIDAMALLNSQTLEPQPTISYNAPGLLSSSADNYQWFIDSVELNGATDQLLTYQYDGSYQVMAINNDGCFALSDPYEVTLSVPTLDMHSLDLSPNPGKTVVTIQTDEIISDVSCFDLNGRSISLSRNGNALNVSSIRQGTYVLKITTDKDIYNVRFIKVD